MCRPCLNAPTPSRRAPPPVLLGSGQPRAPLRLQSSHWPGLRSLATPWHQKNPHRAILEFARKSGEEGQGHARKGHCYKHPAPRPDFESLVHAVRRGGYSRECKSVGGFAQSTLLLWPQTGRGGRAGRPREPAAPGESLDTLQVHCLETPGSESPSPADFAMIDCQLLNRMDHCNYMSLLIFTVTTRMCQPCQVCRKYV